MKNKVKNALMLVSVDYGLYSKLGSPFFVISELKIFFIEHLIEIFCLGNLMTAFRMVPDITQGPFWHFAHMSIWLQFLFSGKRCYLDKLNTRNRKIGSQFAFNIEREFWKAFLCLQTSSVYTLQPLPTPTPPCQM